MKNTNILFAFAALLLMAMPAGAAEIGPAGCGFGNMILGKDMQVLAATTNGTSGSQTFGITTGTLGCEAGGGEAALLNYINTNKIALSNEAARGEGETIAGLAKLVGCQDHRILGTSMKKNFEIIFPNTDVSPAHVTGQVQRLIQTDSRLASSCTLG